MRIYDNSTNQSCGKLGSPMKIVDSESRIWTYLDHLGDPLEIWMIWGIHGYPLFKKPPAMLGCLGWLART